MPVRIGEPFKVQTGVDKHGWKITRTHAVYRCKCGEAFIMQCRSERTTASCGCATVESARQLLTGNTYQRTHGMKDTPTYKSWSKMRERCNNPNYHEFYLYGGRGIRVCERWNSFENFLEDMGVRPPGRSVERIDTNGDYTPYNCRWATPVEQARNKRNNVLLTIGGETKTVVEWSEHPDAASDKTIYARVANGVPAERAVFG